MHSQGVFGTINCYVITLALLSPLPVTPRMDQELIVTILTCFLSVTILVVLQHWFGKKADWDRISQYYTDLYVESFGEEYDEKQLEELFVCFGNIHSWEMTYLKDKTGRSRWVGFVGYESHESAALAAKELNGKVTRILPLQNWMDCVKQLLQGKKLSPGVVTLRVTNLDKEVDDTQLREEFGRLGRITSVKVHMC